jgi:hypothetical protein
VHGSFGADLRLSPKALTGNGARRLTVVFVLHSLTYVRFFESAFHELLERGSEVVLLTQLAPRHMLEERWLADMESRPGFSWRRTKAINRDPWRKLAKRVRRTADYLQFLQPSFARTPALVARAQSRAPQLIVRALQLPGLRRAGVRRALGRAVEALDHAIPSSRLLERELTDTQADVLVLAPHLMPGSRDSEFLKSAHALRIPSCLAVASWDNLSSKQFLHELPDVLIVWNDVQRREATELHRVPEARIAVTGAQNFDLWFDWEPRERGEFCARLGVDADRPYVLYLGGSLFPGELTEAAFARRWVRSLRESDDPALASASVVIRPHPSRVEEWEREGLDELDGVVVWKMPHKEMPITLETRADFFDSIFHATAIAGLNTSAMIEAAIIGRPVHILVTPEFSHSQEGVFHFDYLLNVGGGLAHVGRSLDEHHRQLADTFAGRGEAAAEERRARFLREFVRPHGLDRPATPIFVDIVERAALEGLRGRVPLSLAVARGVVGVIPRVRPKEIKAAVRAARRRTVAATRGRRPA